MVRLLADIAVLDGSLAEKKRHLMDGLCALIKVDCWVWTPVAPVASGQPTVAAGLMHGGFSEGQFAAYLAAIEHPDMVHFNELFLRDVYQCGSHTTRLRQQLDPADTFSHSAVYPLWQAAGVSPILLSCRPFPDRCLSLVALYRSECKALFSERDARIAHVILSSVPWLHAEAWPKASRYRGEALSPRLRTTLNLLLEGLGRKQIAGYMGISENTVAGYVKQVYRFYHVQSHAELMKYFSEGDGGDRLVG